jgi:hypothetical protein
MHVHCYNTPRHSSTHTHHTHTHTTYNVLRMQFSEHRPFMQVLSVQITISKIKHNTFIKHCYMFRPLLPAISRLCLHRTKHGQQ